MISTAPLTSLAHAMRPACGDAAFPNQVGADIAAALKAGTRRSLMAWTRGRQLSELNGCCLSSLLPVPGRKIAVRRFRHQVLG